jgi:hypothetical protein
VRVSPIAAPSVVGIPSVVTLRVVVLRVVVLRVVVLRVVALRVVVLRVDALRAVAPFPSVTAWSILSAG